MHQNIVVKSDAVAIVCGDCKQIREVMDYLTKLGRPRADLLTVAGGSRTFSLFEERKGSGGGIIELLETKMAAALIDFIVYLSHEGEYIDIFDHYLCGFWQEFPDPHKSLAAQTVSMEKASRKIIEIIADLMNGVYADLCKKLKIDLSQIKAKKIVSHYVSLDNNGVFLGIQQIGEIPIPKLCLACPV